jgi:DeoR/GlpR family transcriptional regulator of sugar metabolism
MIELERHGWILSHIENHEYLSLNDAIQALKASPSTVRRDFDTLVAQNFVQRVRGGIRRPVQATPEVLPFDLREVGYTKEKDVMADRAASLLKPNDVIFVDGGTSTHHIAACLPSFALRVITISVPFAMALAKRRQELRNLEVFLTGGAFDLNLGVMLGSHVRESLSRFHVQWSFIAVDGISAHGISNMNYLSIESKQIMIENSEKVVVLADHSKIGKNAMSQICGLNRISILITDEWPENAAMLQTIQKAGVEIIMVSLEGANREENGKKKN